MGRTAIRTPRHPGERGFTLVELLVALVLGLVVVGIGTTVFTAALHSEPRVTGKLTAIAQARTTTERLVRELRQGGTVYTAAASQFSFLTFVHSSTCGGAGASSAIECRVTYSCTATACTRVEAKPNGTSPGPTKAVVSGLSSGSVFTYAPTAVAPKYVEARFSFAGPSDDAITVSDGAALRNRPAP